MLRTQAEFRQNKTIRVKLPWKSRQSSIKNLLWTFPPRLPLQIEKERKKEKDEWKEHNLQKISAHLKFMKYRIARKQLITN